MYGARRAPRASGVSRAIVRFSRWHEHRRRCQTRALEGRLVTGPRPPLPYGPNTAVVRRFLQRLAGKPTADCTVAARTYLALQGTPELVTADRLLGAAIERSGRTDARDAVVGPIVQLMSGHQERLTGPQGPNAPREDDLGEAALAAALALIARDVIPGEAFEVLYRPFNELIPAGDLDS